jgi:hypothetical protein
VLEAGVHVGPCLHGFPLASGVRRGVTTKHEWVIPWP